MFDGTVPIFGQDQIDPETDAAAVVIAEGGEPRKQPNNAWDPSQAVKKKAKRSKKLYCILCMFSVLV